MMTTSSRISRRFTGLVAILIAIFAIILNVAFFLGWYRNGGMPARIQAQTTVVPLKISTDRDGNEIIQIKTPKSNNPRFQRAIVLDADDLQTALSNHIVFAPRLSHIDDDWFLLQKTTQWYIAIDVTQNVVRQQWLFLWSIILILIFSTITYGISQRFVKNSLRDMYTLASRMSASDISNLQDSLVFSHLPENDEINVVAKSIDTMKETIHKQIAAIKDFVWHVSHEFKTPLMVMQSDLDLARHTQDYAALIDRNTQTVTHMSAMLDSLLMLTNLQSGKKLQTDTCDMTALVQRVCDTLAMKYASKHISLHRHIEWQVILETHASTAESVITNILDNAYKYTPDHGEITVTLKPKEICIVDTWIGISSVHQEQIREPFWQLDKNRSDWVGLGLSLVNRMLVALWWTKSLMSVPGKWTTVTLRFSK
jgi:signal transduction histidine kinase